ncbi:MAG: cobalamin adenosyltransferase [Firmicutes bacterium]|jgi:ethanolamine utilization cobalamin adenosyltransferase|nr:cobalamin adenosyltransferase [Bacillota bacterium]
MKILNVSTIKKLQEENPGSSIKIPEDVFISRAARQYIEEAKISLDENALASLEHAEKEGEPEQKTASCCHKTEPKAAGYAKKEKAESTGNKPEHLTNLDSKELVVKDHPRIILRGKLDSFQAELLRLQVLADDKHKIRLLNQLGELLDYSRNILAAEVLSKELEEISLFGMDQQELRYVSQHPKEYYGVGHIPPEYDMGQICVELNALRTKSREVELAAIQAFCKGGKVERNDILRALNRLSSAIYIVYCQYLSESRECLKGREHG